MPVNIFEAKPNRAVRFDEVMAAVVPEGTDADLIDMPREAGVGNILEYAPEDTADRLKKVNSVPNAAFSVSEEEDYSLKLPKVEAGDGTHIYKDAPEEYRYKVLKDKTLTVKSYDQSKLEDVDLEKTRRLRQKDAEKLLRKLGEQFGVFKKYSNSDIRLEFNFSKNNLHESLQKQKSRYDDFAKMMTVFDDVVANAIGIETHGERYSNPSTQLKQMYVLTSAFKTENGIVPVLMEVKEFKDKTDSVLFLTVSLNKIAEADISVYTRDSQTGAASYAPSASIYMLSDIFQNVNPADGDMLQYIPDEFLNDAQREAKQAALERTEQYVREKNRRYQSSLTEEEDYGLHLPYVEPVERTDGRQICIV